MNSVTDNAAYDKWLTDCHLVLAGRKKFASITLKAAKAANVTADQLKDVAESMGLSLQSCGSKKSRVRAHRPWSR